MTKLAMGALLRANYFFKQTGSEYSKAGLSLFCLFVARSEMPDFENKPDVNAALHTLEAGQRQNTGETLTDKELAGMAAIDNLKQAMAQKSQAQAQAYAQTQNLGAGLGQDKGVEGAAFNANGNPDYPEQNITVGSDGTSLAENASDYFDDEENLETLEAENTALVQENNILKTQIETLNKSVAAEHDKMLRAVAEADNVRKRAAQDVERERKYALEKFVRSLLPIYDALEKALEFSDRNNEATKATIDGVENTLTLFLKEMSSFGVEAVDPTGKPFDPNFHQAVSQIPSADVPNNHVVNTLQKGFTLNGRVVRPAMVIVAKS